MKKKYRLYKSRTGTMHAVLTDGVLYKSAANNRSYIKASSACGLQDGAFLTSRINPGDLQKEVTCKTCRRVLFGETAGKKLYLYQARTVDGTDRYVESNTKAEASEEVAKLINVPAEDIRYVRVLEVQEIERYEPETRLVKVAVPAGLNTAANQYLTWMLSFYGGNPHSITFESRFTVPAEAVEDDERATDHINKFAEEHTVTLTRINDRTTFELVGLGPIEDEYMCRDTSWEEID
jgi:hypothetical protein